MPKLGLISLGCAKNLVDSEHMLARLRDAGWEITEDMTEADVGVVNTCGFIEAAKTEAIETILETAQNKQTGNMKGLVVTGCLVQRYADEMRAELPEIDVFCGTGSYDDIVDAANAALKGQQAAYMADMTSAALDGSRDRLTPSYTAYFKIAARTPARTVSSPSCAAGTAAVRWHRCSRKRVRSLTQALRS